MMMKKLMMMAIVVMATVQAHAQLEEGEWSIIPRVGVNIADMTGKLFDATKAEGTYDATLHPLVTVAAGAEGEYGITEQWGFAIGINYARQGAKTDDNLFKVAIDYMNIPLMLEYYPIPNFGLALKAGAQIGLTSHKEVKIDGVTYNADALVRYNWWGRPRYVESELSRQFNKVDFSIPLGISLEVANFVVDARYYLGLTNVTKDDPENSKNRVWQFTLGYKINLY